MIKLRRARRTTLLIVPYGIEIKSSGVRSRRSYRLLIVPYGIEIQNGEKRLIVQFLLIVPYGIEIVIDYAHNPDMFTFNRTLWN